ncbi:MAG: Ldh family oxidoreductase [Chloroflexi bacterium]|nr:Ldh family oxidoreductase [Chloroflexota bacterium]
MTAYQRIDEQELLRFTRQVFEAIAVPMAHAQTMAENLVAGEVHGLGSHGPSRLLRPYVERFRQGGTKRNPDLQVLSRSRGCAVVDGDDGPGAVVGKFAMELAIELAREHGSGWVAVRNSTHFGPAFVFGRMALAHDMIGFSSTNSVPMVAPWGGREKALGTNPICVSVPGLATSGITLDMATTVVARGKVQLAALEDKQIPLGWALDKDGNPTTDPNKGEQMVPVGNYKGYGLALLVDVFCALLSGAAVSSGIGHLFSVADQPQHMGHFFGAMDIAAFGPVAPFKARVDELVAAMKANPLRDGFERILVPGEPEWLKAAEYRREGIPMAEDVIAEMNQIGAELGVETLQIRS